ncbi:GAF domain-containing protein [Pseudomonas sediminis]|uniref:GAF domain-containing protein n=1 Tax=Pseudomonas sediminis TaxID=1691904 RepID=UPI002449F31B|nr:GAF domain-containing protein [Pseudomonas sediminis]MDG9758698.1 GAF domain-containing protein [Pseudomonas sediminis]
MKKFGKNQKQLYDFVEWLYIGATAAAAFLGWVNSVKETDNWIAGRPVLWHVIDIAQKYSFYFYILVGLVIAFGYVYKRLGDPWVMEKLKFTLDQYQFKAFSASTAPTDHNRVTLFKHTENCYFKKHWSAKERLKPWGDCPRGSNFLVPFLRSGHLSQNTKAIFYAPDDSDKAEGVAALAWAKNRTVMQDNLPEMKASSGDVAVRKYAKRTNSNPDMVKKYIAEGRPLPRSIAAIPIESGGKIWGVVVLDSRDPQGVTDKAVNDYQVVIALIGQLLEKA